MRLFKIGRTFYFLCFLISLAGCSNIFETSADVQARQALWDLMEIQDNYRAENGRYARNLIQIEKYNLKYHTGIVYVEIESADNDQYRAVALPAESTTARVFAYDTNRGGFYEMGDEEVSQYVLGALNYIRGEQSKQNLIDFFACLLVGILLLMGSRFLKPFGGKEYRPVLTAFFMSVVPLGWALGLVNHMEKDIVFSST
ncbi:MAG: hypothetical protein V3U37_01395, partial [Nitrospinaceae bacterium]